VEALLEPGRRPPTRSIFASLTDEHVNQIAFTPAHLTQEANVFRAGNIETTLPRGSLMIPATWFLIAIISESIRDRPIYFATTTQAYDELQLRPYLIRQGLAFRLNDGLPEEDPERGIVRIPAISPQLTAVMGEFMDLPTTEALVRDVFMHRGGIPDEWTHWVDRPTQGIPFYYFHVHFATAHVLEAMGRREDAERHSERAQAWYELALR
jgi:hypothetical protein